MPVVAFRTGSTLRACGSTTLRSLVGCGRKWLCNKGVRRSEALRDRRGLQ